jgi:hypothetical protein
MVSGEPDQIASSSASAFMDSLATYRHNCGLPGISLQLGGQCSHLTKNNVDSKSMEHSEWAVLIMKAMSVPIACQVMAELDANTISTTPCLAQDPFFAHILLSTMPSSSKKSKVSPEEANELVVNMLRVAMELQATERLGTCYFPFSGQPKLTTTSDTNEPLTSCGADSITFAQFKGQVLKELDVNVPVMYLSDDYTINDMIVNIVETYAAA